MLDNWINFTCKRNGCFRLSRFRITVTIKSRINGKSSNEIIYTREKEVKRKKKETVDYPRDC